MTTVQCYSGHSYAQEPRSFVLEGERLSVAAVCQSWREPAGPRFKVRAEDGGTYVLAYDEAADSWRVAPVRGTFWPAEAEAEIIVERKGGQR